MHKQDVMISNFDFRGSYTSLVKYLALQGPLTVHVHTRRLECCDVVWLTDYDMVRILDQARLSNNWLDNMWLNNSWLDNMWLNG